MDDGRLRILIIRSGGSIAPHIINNYDRAFKSIGVFTYLLDIRQGISEDQVNLISEFNPDLALCYGLNGLIPIEDGYLFRFMGIPLVCLHFDNPFFVIGQHHKQEMINYHRFYYHFVWDKYYLDLMKNEGYQNVNRILLATDLQEFYPIHVENGYHQNAVVFVGRILSKVDLNISDHPLVNEFVSQVISKKTKDLSRPTFDICLELFHNSKYSQIAGIYFTNPVAFWQQLYVAIHVNGSSMIRRHVVEHIRTEELHIYGARDWNAPGVTMHSEVEYGYELSRVFQSYAININISGLQLETSVNNRLFDIYAARGFLLTDYRDDVKTIFPYHWNSICYRSVDELNEKIEYFLTHPKEREEITNDLYQCIQTSHAYKNRAIEILQSIQLHTQKKSK